MVEHRGNSRTYLLGRLQEVGRSDLADDVSAGLLSTKEAAREAGLRPPLLDPDLSSNLQKRKAFKRNPRRASRDAECWYGPSTNQPSMFKDTEAARRYWRENSARLMPLHMGGGRRPLAWWRFTAGMPYPETDADQAAILHELGALGVVEEAELLPRWRAQFDRICGLRGITAIRDALDQTPLPRSLFMRWCAERRANRRTIRALEVEASVAELGALRGATGLGGATDRV